MGSGTHEEGKGLAQGHVEDEWQSHKKRQVTQAPVLTFDLDITVKCHLRAEFHLSGNFKQNIHG